MEKIGGKKLATWIVVAAIAVFSFLLYSFRLDKVPVHLNQDELEFSLNALSISRTLHDSYGNFLPIYFKHLDTFWATPVIVYLTSLFLKFLPLTEWSIRLPSVTIAVISIVLTAFLAKKLFKNNLYLILGALIMASTPSLFINSRVLLDNIYPIPFVLMWLVFTYKYQKTKNRWYIFLSGLSLGVGFHSYHAAKVMMPIYFGATLLSYLRVEKKNVFPTGLFLTIGFLIPILAFLPWLRAHPDTLTSQISYVSGIDKSISYDRGVFGVLNFDRFPAFVESYGNYLSPGILFVTGDRSLIHSTRSVGAFLFPFIVLLAFGIFYIVIKRRDVVSKLILLGFLTYPIAPSLINEPERISRGMIVIPFVVLIVLFGMEFLLTYPKKIVKLVISSIFVLALLQFGNFLSYYYGEYRSLSYVWFNYDIGAAMKSVLISTRSLPVKTIFIESSIPFASRYWKFYEEETGIFPNGTVLFFDGKREDFSVFPSGSMAIVPSWVSTTDNLTASTFLKIATVREPDGTVSFNIFWNIGNGKMKK